ncbi:MAG: flavodoxin family protein, partial [Clostridiales bacterium]|nr:flavodoxin family protein [Clostridiales bacterium]
MKIIAISGGTKDGSNDAMAREALMGAKEEGAEVEFIRLHDLDLKPCTGCVACVISLVNGGNGDCVIKDDLKWLDDKLLDADGV